MKTRFCFIPLLCLAQLSHAQDLSTTINLDKTGMVLSTAPFMESGCVALVGPSPVKLYMVTPGYKKVKTIEIIESAASSQYMSYMTTGIGCPYVYVCSVARGKGGKLRGADHELWRIDSVGNKTRVGEFFAVGGFAQNYVGNFATKTALYLVSYSQSSQDAKGNNSPNAIFEIISVKHDSKEIIRKEVFIPGNSDDYWATFSGNRGDVLYFNFVSRKPKATNKIWSFSMDEGLEELFTVELGKTAVLSPQRMFQETFGGRYRDYSNWYVGSDATFQPHSGSLAHIMPDPFGSGFYQLTLLQEVGSEAHISSEPCTAYNLEYYSHQGKKMWAKKCVLPEEITESQVFKKPIMRQARAIKLTPLDSGLLRITFFGGGDVFPILFSDKQCGSVSSYKFKTVAPGFGFLDAYEPFFSAYVSNEENLTNYQNYLEEMKPETYKPLKYHVYGANGLEYMHLLVFSEATRTITVGAYETKYAKSKLKLE